MTLRAEFGITVRIEVIIYTANWAISLFFRKAKDELLEKIIARKLWLADYDGWPDDEVALDCMLERDGRGLLYVPFLNYAEGSLDAALEMMLHEDTILGLGDGGAHVGMICDGSFTTHMLTHWTRDRTRGDKLSVPWVIKAHCLDTARAVGLHDRGLLAPGYKGDLNVIDYEHLTLRAPEVLHDLPAGGRRLMQRADGYTATVVSGEVVYENGEHTGALPGKLIRGARTAPARA